MQLPEACYAIVELRELKLNSPNLLRRFGVDFVVWRSSEGWVAQDDRCPHRSASLSLGKIKNDRVACPFHGFEFAADGRCTLLPETGKGAPGLKVSSFKLIEHAGFLWLNTGASRAKPSWFEDFESPRFTWAGKKHRWPTHFTRCVENQLDYAHLPFVHHNTIGRGFSFEPKYSLVKTDKSLRVNLDAQDMGAANFEFLFPNVWRLKIAEKFFQMLVFVPVDESTTVIYERTYHAFTRLPLVRDAIAKISGVFNKIILNQDKAVVLSQLPRDVRSASGEKLFESDKAIREFRKWLGSVSAPT